MFLSLAESSPINYTVIFAKSVLSYLAHNNLDDPISFSNAF